LERLLWVPKAGARVVAKALEQMFISLLAPFDADHLQIMIDHDWHVIESVRWTTAQKMPNYPPEMDPAEIKRLEAMRGRLVKAAMAALGFSRMTLSRFPRPLVEQYLNREYALKWFSRHRQDLLPKLQTEKGARWLEKEVEEVKKFLWG